MHHAMDQSPTSASYITLKDWKQLQTESWGEIYGQELKNWKNESWGEILGQELRNRKTKNWIPRRDLGPPVSQNNSAFQFFSSISMWSVVSLQILTSYHRQEKTTHLLRTMASKLNHISGAKPRDWRKVLRKPAILRAKHWTIRSARPRVDYLLISSLIEFLSTSAKENTNHQECLWHHCDCSQVWNR